MDWTTVYTVTTKQGDFVGNRYSEASAMLLMKSCDRTRLENSPHQITIWHDTETRHTFAARPAENELKL